MKKAGIITLIVILILLILSLVQLLIIFTNHEGFLIQWGERFGEVERIESNIRKDEKMSLEGIENIVITAKIPNINVIETEEQEIRVIEYSNKELKEHKIFQMRKDGNTIQVEDPKNKIEFHLWDVEFIVYDVYLPKSYTSNLKVKTISGEIFIQKELTLNEIILESSSGNIKSEYPITGEEINLKTISGDIKIEELKGNQVTLETASGNVKTQKIGKKEENVTEKTQVELKTISGDIKVGTVTNQKVYMKTASGNIETEAIDSKEEIELKTISGEIELNQMQAKIVKTESTSGNIRLGKVEGNMEVKNISGEVKIEEVIGEMEGKTTSGNIKIGAFEMKQDTKVQSISGNISIKLIGNSNCEIKTKTTSGDVKTPNDSHIVGEAPYLSLELKTTSGNITVTQ